MYDAEGGRALRDVGAMTQFLAGMMTLARELSIFLAPYINSLQALRVAVLGAGERRLGPRQPDDRLPRRGHGPGCTSSAASRVAT